MVVLQLLGQEAVECPYRVFPLLHIVIIVWDKDHMSFEGHVLTVMSRFMGFCADLKI